MNTSCIINTLNNESLIKGNEIHNIGNKMNTTNYTPEQLNTFSVMVPDILDLFKDVESLAEFSDNNYLNNTLATSVNNLGVQLQNLDETEIVDGEELHEPVLDKLDMMMPDVFDIVSDITAITELFEGHQAAQYYAANVANITTTAHGILGTLQSV